MLIPNTFAVMTAPTGATRALRERACSRLPPLFAIPVVKSSRPRPFPQVRVAPVGASLLAIALRLWLFRAGAFAAVAAIPPPRSNTAGVKLLAMALRFTRAQPTTFAASPLPQVRAAPCESELARDCCSPFRAGAFAAMAAPTARDRHDMRRNRCRMPHRAHATLAPFAHRVPACASDLPTTTATRDNPGMPRHPHASQPGPRPTASRPAA